MHALAIAATVLLGALLSAMLVRMAPGVEVDEQQLDSHLNAQSLQALRDLRLGQKNILRFYLHSIRRSLTSADSCRTTTTS